MRRSRKTTSIYSDGKNWKTRKSEPGPACVRSPAGHSKNAYNLGVSHLGLLLAKLECLLGSSLAMFTALKCCRELCPHGQQLLVLMKL